MDGGKESGTWWELGVCLMRLWEELASWTGKRSWSLRQQRGRGRLVLVLGSRVANPRISLPETGVSIQVRQKDDPILRGLGRRLR